MTTSSKTEGDSQTSDWIEKTVSDTFDEFLAAISTETKFHISEEHNRDPTLMEDGHALKIYDVINSYHSFCQLCQQHFYTFSVASDINSFFQKHMNTSYHRQLRQVDLPPDTEPIFTWEEKYITGRCNICNISGLNAYIMDTLFDPVKLIKFHICVWDKENRETNVKVLRKLNLLKKYCGLKIFQEKFIKTTNGGHVCLLCGLKLPWPVEKASCHLTSDGHYQKFCLFLRKCFNFGPMDVLNGFNLEVVTRALITRDPPPIANFTECDYETKCLLESNNNENPYPDEKENYSFSPKQSEGFLRDEDSDFVYNGQCLLCNMAAQPGHGRSQLHQDRARVLNEEAFDNPNKYKIYCRNRTKRLRMVDKLKRLELGVDEPIPREPSPRKVREAAQKGAAQTNYFKAILKEKLELVELVFTEVNERKLFCEVCDEQIPVSHEVSHLNTSYHKLHVTKWRELRRSVENKKFSETFLKLRDVILCLICGAVVHPNNFYSHLNGEMHSRKFEEYSKLDVDVPISSAFTFLKDFSCSCTVCNSQLNKRDLSLKVSLKNIMSHWPCPRLTGKKKGLRKDPRLMREANKQTESDGQSGAEEKPKEPQKENTPKVDFKKVVKSVVGIVDAFEKKIIQSVVEKTAVNDQLDGLKLDDEKEEGKTSEDATAGEQSSCGCSDSSLCTCATKPPAITEKTEVKEKFKKVRKKGELTAENKTTNHKEGERGKDAAEGEAEDHEVLVLEGLPKSKRRYDIIYNKFGVFGKIRYVFFDGKLAVLSFVKPGVAAVAAKNSPMFINNSKVRMFVSTKKAHVKTVEEQPPTLNSGIVQLLEDPQKLMDFVLNLVMQAVAMSESPVERKREELVCSTIISAIYEIFPQGRCYPFGSRLSGLTLNNSDLDVFLDCGGMYEGFKNTTPSQERKLVNRVAGLLRKKPEITDINVVSRARVPIVSFLHKPTQMYCDLSFKNGLSIQNTLLIKFMTSLDWRVRPLILFLKHWAKLNGLHGPPNFSSYAIAMLVIYYLQQLECPVLPTIESLQSNCVGRRTTIGGWDCSINMNASILKKSENKVPFPELLAGLFEFYATFDYNTNVISPLTGKLLSRKAFSSSSDADLPMCYKRHIVNIPPPIENLVNNKIHICIIDPFDVSHVLTKSFTSRGLQIFTYLCQESEKHLQKGMTAFASQS